jgi:hypothetical protein
MPFVVLFTVSGGIWGVWLVGYAMLFVKQKAVTNRKGEEVGCDGCSDPFSRRLRFGRTKVVGVNRKLELGLGIN